jgi:hypothetical protein
MDIGMNDTYSSLKELTPIIFDILPSLKGNDTLTSSGGDSGTVATTKNNWHQDSPDSATRRRLCASPARICCLIAPLCSVVNMFGELTRPTSQCLVCDLKDMPKDGFVELGRECASLCIM